MCVCVCVCVCVWKKVKKKECEMVKVNNGQQQIKKRKKRWIERLLDVRRELRPQQARCTDQGRSHDQIVYPHTPSPSSPHISHSLHNKPLPPGGYLHCLHQGVVGTQQELTAQVLQYQTNAVGGHPLPGKVGHWTSQFVDPAWPLLTVIRTILQTYATDGRNMT